MTSTRWDETWHRLREWTNGQGPSERIAAQLLLQEEYSALDPSHPLGGPDGGKDATCERNGARWVLAVYFPRGQLPIASTKNKLIADITGEDSIAHLVSRDGTILKSIAAKGGRAPNGHLRYLQLVMPRHWKLRRASESPH